jgi:hypothetical protein
VNNFNNFLYFFIIKYVIINNFILSTIYVDVLIVKEIIERLKKNYDIIINYYRYIFNSNVFLENFIFNYEMIYCSN